MILLNQCAFYLEVGFEIDNIFQPLALSDNQKIIVIMGDVTLYVFGYRAYWNICSDKQIIICKTNNNLISV